MDNFFRENNVAEKLKNAIEELRVGQGLQRVFKGLEDGVCTVDVVYNGENVVFVSKMPEEKPVIAEDTVEAEIQVGDVGEQDITESPEPESVEIVEEKPKRRRKKVEDSES